MTKGRSGGPSHFLHFALAPDTMRLRLLSATPRTSGAAVAAALPWLIAAAGLAFGVTMWLSARTPTNDVAARNLDSADVQRLRLSLESTRAENQALRQELDRLLGTRRIGSSSVNKAAEPAASTKTAPDDPQIREISQRLGESLAKFSAGDQSGMQTAAADIWALVRHGHDALPALLDLYMGASSPDAKKIILAPLLFIGGAEGRDFVMSQAETESDPSLRKILLDQSAKYATPEVAERAQGTFLERLQSDEDAATRLIAVRGLRYAQGADAQAALLRAAADPDEKVRLAAMDVLAARPAIRQQLRELATNDSSAHVREVAQCRLMVAENMP